MHPELEATMARGRSVGVTQRVARDIDPTGRMFRLEPDGRCVVSFATCSYLGLDRDLRLWHGAKDAIDRFGVAFSASRCFVTSPLYGEVDALLAEIFGRPVVLAGSTTLAHGAALPILVDRRDVILMDRQVHHSVQTAVAALPLPRTARIVVAHSDMAALEEAIRDAIAKGARRVWYCADGIYSMFGDRLPIAGLVRLMQRYEQLHAYLDDAHGMSWCGTHGAGSLVDAALPRERTVIATSLSKGFGCGGGVIAVPDVDTKHRIENLGPSLMFSIQVPPPILGAVCASARIHLSDEIVRLQAEQHERTMFARAAFESDPVVGPRVIRIDGPATPVQYVVLGTANTVIDATAEILERGFLVNPVAFPAVPRDAGGLRITITRSHTAEDIRDLVSAIREVASVFPAPAGPRAPG